MAIAVPGEGRDAIAELDPVALESFGDLERALPNLAVVGVVHRPFDRPRGDLLLRELDGGEIDDLVHEQGPILHPSQHAFFSRLALSALDRGARIVHGTTTLAPCAPLGNAPKVELSSPLRPQYEKEPDA